MLIQVTGLFEKCGIIYYVHPYAPVAQWIRVSGFYPFGRRFESYPGYQFEKQGGFMSQDYGKQPYVVNIKDLTNGNDNFRTAVWTGQFMQMTLMSILPGDDIGAEVHGDHDQFLRIEQGEARVLMGDSQDDILFEASAGVGFAIFVPAGKWHNVINVGDNSLKLYSIYAPAEHPLGTIHQTKPL